MGLAEYGKGMQRDAASNGFGRFMQILVR